MPVRAGTVVNNSVNLPGVPLRQVRAMKFPGLSLSSNLLVRRHAPERAFNLKVGWRNHKCRILRKGAQRGSYAQNVLMVYDSVSS